MIATIINIRVIWNNLQEFPVSSRILWEPSSQVPRKYPTLPKVVKELLQYILPSEYHWLRDDLVTLFVIFDNVTC